jgi:serine/threonine-protein kinase HipA
MTFDYAPEWFADPETFPISQSLPLDGLYRHGIVDHAFFSNLLPEADVRETLCRALGISLSNDFELLRRIGGECAGALSLYEEGMSSASGSSYRLLDDTELATATGTRIATERLIPGARLRFSLAGGQDKWPVYVEGGRLHLPEGTAPSSHILKFDSLRFKGTGWNEAFVSFLGRRLGLPATEVRPFDGYTLSERYDRRRKADGGIERLHQEDFCQALGLPPGRKYESEGGPGFSECFDLLRRTSSVPAVDTMNLLRWQIANVLLGNADGHAKNLSLLYDWRQCRLAPFYDLVCTGIYPGISRDLAMAVGKEHDPGQVRKRDWEALAENAGIRPRVVFRLLEEMMDTLSIELVALTKNFQETIGRDPVIDRVRVHVQSQVRRTRTLAHEHE